MSEKVPISIVMLTLNEEHNLVDVLDNVQPWAEDVFIVDSLSTDRTVDIALERGVKIVQREFTNFGDQWNWALENLPIASLWTMKLDPDERLPEALKSEIAALLAGEPDRIAYALKRRLWFMGRPMRQQQWVTRLWRHGQVRFSDVLVNEHPIVTDADLGRLRGTLEHLDSPALHHWFDKQNQYTTMRAIEMARGCGFAAAPRLRGSGLERRMFAKQVFFSLPGRHLLHRLYLLLVRGAILDGSVGWDWAMMRTAVYRWAEMKGREIRTTGHVPEVPQMRHGEPDPRVTRSPLQAEARRRAARPPRAAASILPPRRLKVAVNAVPLDQGGGLVVLLGLLEGWRDTAAPLHLTLYASRRAVIDAIRDRFPGVRVEPFAEGMPSAQHFFLQQTRLASAIDRTGADVVLSTNMAVRGCHLPQVVHHQNLKRFQHRQVLPQLRANGVAEAVKDVAARAALRSATANVFISHYLRQAAEQIAAGTHDRNAVVPNGVSEALIRQTIDHPPHDGASRHLIALQSPSPHKDNPTLLRAFAKVIGWQPDEPWELTIAGVNMEQWFGSLAAELGVADRVHFPGYLNHEQLDPLFRRSLCLVFPSRLEGFGNPPLEAMARGCPTVASDCTAIPEVVGDAGVLVPPGDVEGFARPVIRLATDAAFREDLIRRGLERVRGFTWQASAQRLCEILYTAAGRGVTEAAA